MGSGSRLDGGEGGFIKTLIFHWFFHYFRNPKGSQVEVYVEVYVGAKLELVLGSMLDRFWEVFGGQDGPKMAPSWPQDGSRWHLRWC